MLLIHGIKSLRKIEVDSGAPALIVLCISVLGGWPQSVSLFVLVD